MKVLFLVTTPNCGSGRNRALDVGKAMEGLGVETRVIRQKRYPAVLEKADVAVFVKKWDPAVAEMAKDQGAKIVHDVVDNEGVWERGWGDGPPLDAAILSTKKLMFDMLEKVPTPKILAVIPHCFDPRFRSCQMDEFKLAYIGSESNVLTEHKGLAKVVSADKRAGAFSDAMFEDLRQYSCHLSVRREGSLHFKYKPNSKLAAAAGSWANIILTRDCSHQDLLPGEYPYFTDSNRESVSATIEYAKCTFDRPVWRLASTMMAHVRDRLRPEAIAKQYVQLAEEVLS